MLKMKDGKYLFFPQLHETAGTTKGSFSGYCSCCQCQRCLPVSVCSISQILKDLLWNFTHAIIMTLSPEHKVWAQLFKALLA